jgi:hypothetical protein
MLPSFDAAGKQCVAGGRIENIDTFSGSSKPARADRMINGHFEGGISPVRETL